MTEAIADHTRSVPPESVTGPAGAVYQTQLAFERAQYTYEWEYRVAQDQHDDAQRAAAARGGIGPMSDPYNAPKVREARADMELMRERMEAHQREIGGVVFCLATDNFSKVERKLTALSKRAVKLGLDPIDLKVTDEKVLLEYTYAEDEFRGYNGTFEHVYCILSGGTPKVEGFQFLATIEHTDAGNLVKKIPVLAAQMRGLVPNGPEDRAQQALEAIDVTKYRNTPPICEHCNKIRSRKDTYLVYNNETGEIKQVGRSCLRDYTGADNPEAIVKFLEMYFESMRMARTSRGETPTIPTVEFLAHVAAVMGPNGYEAGGITRDDALTNYWNMVNKRRDGKTQVPLWVEPNQSHFAAAESIRKWALNEWTDEGDYALNVKTAIANEAVPQKGYGIVASVFAAKKRFEAKADERKEREQEDAAKAQRGWVGEPKQRLDFTLTVLNINTREGYLGETAYTIRFEDENGNRLTWFASNWPTLDNEPIQEGGTYKIKATVKNHDEHSHFGKATIITRGKALEAINVPEVTA